MKNDPMTKALISRRRLLTRVGLAAGAAYIAPAMVGLNAARASGVSGGGSDGSGSGSSSGPSQSSGPSRSSTSGMSSSSGASSPSRSDGTSGGDVPVWLKKILPGI